MTVSEFLKGACYKGSGFCKGWLVGFSQEFGVQGLVSGFRLVRVSFAV